MDNGQIKATWDGFWQVVFGIFTALALTTCISCSSEPKKSADAQLVQDLAKNCKQGGMSDADVDREKDGDVHVHVACHAPAARSR